MKAVRAPPRCGTSQRLDTGLGQASTTESGSHGPLGETVDKPPGRAGQGPLVGGGLSPPIPHGCWPRRTGLIASWRPCSTANSRASMGFGPRPAPAQVARSPAARAGRSGLLVDGREGSNKRVGDVEQIVWIALAPRHGVGLAVLLVEGGHDLLQRQVGEAATSTHILHLALAVD